MKSHWTLEDWIWHVNKLGLQIHQITQLDDGTWRVSFKVFGATPDLARNPSYTDYGHDADPRAAFEKALASKRFRAEWEPKARAAVEAWEKGTAIASPWPDQAEACRLNRDANLIRVKRRNKLHDLL